MVVCADENWITAAERTTYCTYSPAQSTFVFAVVVLFSVFQKTRERGTVCNVMYEQMHVIMLLLLLFYDGPLALTSHVSVSGQWRWVSGCFSKLSLLY